MLDLKLLVAAANAELLKYVGQDPTTLPTATVENNLRIAQFLLKIQQTENTQKTKKSASIVVSAGKDLSQVSTEDLASGLAYLQKLAAQQTLKAPGKNSVFSHSPQSITATTPPIYD